MFFVFSQVLLADEIHLTDGSVVRGKIQEQGFEGVTIKIDKSNQKTNDDNDKSVVGFPNILISNIVKDNRIIAIKPRSDYSIGLSAVVGDNGILSGGVIIDLNMISLYGRGGFDYFKAEIDGGSNKTYIHYTVDAGTILFFYRPFKMWRHGPSVSYLYSQALGHGIGTRYIFGARGQRFSVNYSIGLGYYFDIEGSMRRYTNASTIDPPLWYKYGLEVLLGVEVTWYLF